jgi:fumarylacetoacetate (FAA) hydrolase
MKLATLASVGRDGTLVVVSQSGERFLKAGGEFSTLRQALDNWPQASEMLRALAGHLERGEGTQLSDRELIAPLPRAARFLRAPFFSNRCIKTESGASPREIALIHRGYPSLFHGPTEAVSFPQETGGISLKGEFAVIVDNTPAGVSPTEAAAHIRLIVQISNWSLRQLVRDEMKPGFREIKTTAARSMAPFAITPDELGDHWRGGHVDLELAVSRNGVPCAIWNGGCVRNDGFPELVARAASRRPLPAGSVVGPAADGEGTPVSQPRADHFLQPPRPIADRISIKFGDRVRIEAKFPDSVVAPFGAMDQIAVEAEAWDSLALASQRTNGRARRQS